MSLFNTILEPLDVREDVDVKFPKPSVTSSVSEKHIEAVRQVKEMVWKKEKMLEDMKREQALLNNAKFNFDRKKQEFLKFLAESSSYATQVMPSTDP
jgi:tRNA(Glu) U13 pseudouridine synthase TruD